jgi:hypothetical protein
LKVESEKRKVKSEKRKAKSEKRLCSWVLCDAADSQKWLSHLAERVPTDYHMTESWVPGHDPKKKRRPFEAQDKQDRGTPKKGTSGIRLLTAMADI